MSEPRGPVHLDLPEDVALAPAREERRAGFAAGQDAPAPDAAIARAGELIAKASRPIAVIGSSAMRMADPELLRRVGGAPRPAVRHHDHGQGDDRRGASAVVGCIERGCRQVQRKILRSADLIVGLGYDTVEVEYEAWIGDVPLLQVDIEKADVAPSVKVAHEVTGDLDASLRRSPPCPPRPTNGPATRWTRTGARSRRRCGRQARISPRMPPSTRCAARCRATGCCVRRRRPHPPDREPVDRARAENLPHHQRLVVDGLRPAGAIAAKLARPDLPVVCLIGDGCFQMTCGEVATAKRWG
jgi:acetolactate synthase I/II/III large subunit